MMLVDQLDHLVLTVNDIDASSSFYASVLGMRVEEFGSGRKALVFGRQKINLHQAGSEFAPHAQRPTPGAADLCFLTSVPMDRVIAHISEHKHAIIEGPVRRTGATGPLLSVYLRDPDGNLIELATQLSTSDRNRNHAA